MICRLNGYLSVWINNKFYDDHNLVAWVSMFPSFNSNLLYVQETNEYTTYESLKHLAQVLGKNKVVMHKGDASDSNKKIMYNGTIRGVNHHRIDVVRLDMNLNYQQKYVSKLSIKVEYVSYNLMLEKYVILKLTYAVRNVSRKLAHVLDNIHGKAVIMQNCFLQPLKNQGIAFLLICTGKTLMYTKRNLKLYDFYITEQ
ncbi:hypothetical protein BDA99DRAFT_543280 [Phascolomyces articulosus]|uniref:Uncharacterized protein n=1 Tax=Phascolomyces articulosus TaxID=60185 RepID=A0AAD5K198_9FUNG|nr:hypothetical protein BDA99DRAFT_543280 [Phascolomyces articulosus]